MNAAALRRDALLERLGILSLSAPALLLVFVTMLLPVGWLFGLSLLAHDGSLTIEHYTRGCSWRRGEVALLRAPGPAAGQNRAGP